MKSDCRWCEDYSTYHGIAIGRNNIIEYILKNTCTETAFGCFSANSSPNVWPSKSMGCQTANVQIPYVAAWMRRRHIIIEFGNTELNFAILVSFENTFQALFNGTKTVAFRFTWFLFGNVRMRRHHSTPTLRMLFIHFLTTWCINQFSWFHFTWVWVAAAVIRTDSRWNACEEVGYERKSFKTQRRDGIFENNGE